MLHRTRRKMQEVGRKTVGPETKRPSYGILRILPYSKRRGISVSTATSCLAVTRSFSLLFLFFHFYFFFSASRTFAWHVLRAELKQRETKKTGIMLENLTSCQRKRPHAESQLRDGVPTGVRKNAEGDCGKCRYLP